MENAIDNIKSVFSKLLAEEDLSQYHVDYFTMEDGDFTILQHSLDEVAIFTAWIEKENPSNIEVDWMFTNAREIENLAPFYSLGEKFIEALNQG